MIQFYWHFDVVVHLDNTFYRYNSHISANLGTKVHIISRLIFSSEFVTFWGATRGEGIQDQRWQNVTFGRGSKTSIFEWNFLHGLEASLLDFLESACSLKSTRLYLQMLWISIIPLKDACTAIQCNRVRNLKWWSWNMKNLNSGEITKV